MYDLVFSLHTFLLLIGALMVAGIYLWTGNKIHLGKNTKNSQKNNRSELSASMRATDGGVLPNSDNGDMRHPKAGERGLINKLLESEIAEERPATELPRITREDDVLGRSRARKMNNNQLELTFEVKEAPENDRQVVSQESLSEEHIIKLYIRAIDEGEFAGPTIVRAMNNAGLRFGVMDIYHYFSNGDGLSQESPLFSVANMLEPGYFELSNIEKFSTPGLVLFLQLPSLIDGPSAFDLFLRRARRIAEVLPGDLYSDRKELLDDDGIDRLRQLVAAFDNAH